MPQLIRQWILAFISPRPLIGVLYLVRYARHWRKFASKLARSARPRFSDSYPCLGDWTQNTSFDPHYYYQGAWLSRRLASTRPCDHVDIGSSILTMGVLSATVRVVHVDYRPALASLPGLDCRGGDILALPFASHSLSSVSCLHVLEHVGLGRYGDSVDPYAFRKAAEELARVLALGGRLYVSVPVGRERVCFNAHRVFAYESVLELFSSLRLENFALVDDAGRYDLLAQVKDTKQLLYGCGMFEFMRA